MDDLPASYLQFVEQLHALCDYETSYRKLSELLGMAVRPGLINSFIPGDPPTIFLEPHLFGWSQSNVGLHEFAHGLVLASGIESAIKSQSGTPDCATKRVEDLCRLTSVVLRIPRPLLDDAMSRFGDTPATILHLRDNAKVNIREAMVRYVLSDPNASRAAFMTSGSYISELATCNSRLPFARYDRVTEPEWLVPDARFRSVGPGRLIGTAAW